MNDRDIRRGDIFYIKNDDNAVGFEQKKTRPCILPLRRSIVRFRPTFEFAVMFRPSLSVSRL